MSKERELLQFILNSHAANGSKLDKFWKAKIEELLAQPEQDLEVLKKDWVNFGCTAGRKEGYDQGFNDGKYLSSPKREPLSYDRLVQLYALRVINDPIVFARQVEKEHGIGLDE